MEIKIVFEIEEGSKQVIGDFSKALMGLGERPVMREIAGNRRFVPVEVPASQNEEAPKEMPSPTETPKEAEPPAGAAKETPEPAEMPAEESPKAKKAAKKKSEPLPTVAVEYTRADLARVGRELATSGKRDEVLKAFTKFHAMSLADIKPEDFNALAQIYIELGGKF